MRLVLAGLQPSASHAFTKTTFLQEVNRAITFGKELPAETVGNVIYHFGLLVGEQFAIVAMRRDEAFRFHKSYGSYTSYKTY